ncbi:hypothetical protein CEXT_481461 [Caerostris extrusa]|uniref:Uncharacterized protein n=1 Tax=Caerostris extrusa TaxID=172846 RepID=A0AAV4WBC9_CAEEX|nr:hypothetical protein CEXT_481461 [Caerostris extrusa]
MSWLFNIKCRDKKKHTPLMPFMYSKTWHCVREKGMDYSNAWLIVTEAKTLAMAWHGIKKTPPFGSRGYLFRIQTLKEFVLPVIFPSVLQSCFRAAL